MISLVSARLHRTLATTTMARIFKLPNLISYPSSVINSCILFYKSKFCSEASSIVNIRGFHRTRLFFVEVREIEPCFPVS